MDDPKQVTIKGLIASLERTLIMNGNLPIFYNDNVLDEWPLEDGIFVVSLEKRTPGFQGDNYYPKRVTIKIFT